MLLFNNIFLNKLDSFPKLKYNVIFFNLYFSLKNEKISNSYSKFKFLKKYILSNKLFTKSQIKYLFDIFNYSQKIYWSFNSLSKSYKIKKMKLYDYNFDLNFNSLDIINKKLIIYIYNFETKIFYKFKITDLINIINYSICYMNNNIHEILDIKNPFTNIPFSKSELYYIHAFIANSNLVMPSLFHLYFLKDFNKKIFFDEYEIIIKNQTLLNYYNNISSDEKILIIKNIINEFKDIFQFNENILNNNDEEFINSFKFCIKDYIFLNYSNNFFIINQYKEILLSILLNCKVI